MGKGKSKNIRNSFKTPKNCSGNDYDYDGEDFSLAGLNSEDEREFSWWVHYSPDGPMDGVIGGGSDFYLRGDGDPTYDGRKDPLCRNSSGKYDPRMDPDNYDMDGRYVDPKRGSNCDVGVSRNDV